MRVRKRPDFVTGFTQKVQTGLGGMYLTVNEVDGKPFEIFATIGKSGHSVTAKPRPSGGSFLWPSIRHRRCDVVGQLKGIGGEHPIFQKKGLLLSIPDAIAWVLENRYLKGRNPRTHAHRFGLRPSALPRLRRRARFSGRLPSLPQLRLHQVRRLM